MKLNKNKELNAKNKIVNLQERKIVNSNKKSWRKNSPAFFYDGRLFFKNSRMPKTQLKEVAKKINSPGPIKRIPKRSINV